MITFMKTVHWFTILVTNDIKKVNIEESREHVNIDKITDKKRIREILFIQH